jgi:hypothetical protein
LRCTGVAVRARRASAGSKRACVRACVCVCVCVCARRRRARCALCVPERAAVCVPQRLLLVQAPGSGLHPPPFTRTRAEATTRRAPRTCCTGRPGLTGGAVSATCMS